MLYDTTMKTKNAYLDKLYRCFRLCPIRHSLLLLGLFGILLHLLSRRSPAWMRFVSRCVVQPINHMCSRISAVLPFSLAELLIVLGLLTLLVYLVWMLVTIVRRGEAGKRLYRLAATLLSAVTVIYSGFCLLWGCYFYDESFAQRNALEDGPVSVEQLERVTVYFAALANVYADQVQRDAQGCYTVDRQRILECSPLLYEEVEALYPSLEGPRVKTKGFFCSKFLSLLDFTGFYFPLTGEANVNMDFPPSLFPATVAHEISHQRGICREQEANFLAVLSSLENGDVDFCYSACLLAYTHLGNALYKADRGAWQAVYRGLDEKILLDFAANRSYWAQFETPVQSVSNTVYESFMYSYDQELGLQSYGACVDLLVHYYEKKAMDYFS